MSKLTKILTNPVLSEAFEKAGFRERYAMEHGSRRSYYSGGKKFVRFTYSNDLEYQDANGATFCVTTKTWVS